MNDVNDVNDINNDINDVNNVNDVFIHPSSFVDEDVSIGSGTKIWHFSHVQSGAVIGEHCSLGQNVNVAQNVKIGKGCRIQNNVSIYEGVELEDYVFCGPSCVFTNVSTPRAKYPVHGYYKHTVIEEGASLGANCTIVCGHRVGKWALVAAGAVVASDVPAYGLMMGVPARQKGWVCECGHQLSSQQSCSTGSAISAGAVDSERNQDFAEQNVIECESCGRKYELIKEELRQISTPPRQHKDNHYLYFYQYLYSYQFSHFFKKHITWAALSSALSSTLSAASPSATSEASSAFEAFEAFAMLRGSALEGRAA